MPNHKDRIGPLDIPLIPPGTELPPPNVIHDILERERNRGKIQPGIQPGMEISEHPEDRPEEGPPRDPEDYRRDRGERNRDDGYVVR